VVARTGLQVLQIEAEDVVTLDDVRIALANQSRRLLEQGPLVEPIPADHVDESRGVGQRESDDAVGLARGVGELVAVAGDDLDVERQAPQVAETHPAE